MTSILLPLLAACGLSASDPAPADPPLAPEPPRPEQLAKVHDRMAKHYLLATDARAAVIRGDVAAAQQAGKALSALTTEGLPATWVPHLDQLQQAGRELSMAPSISEAGLAVGRIGRICADCHGATGGGPRLTGEGAPAPAWSEDAHMSRHLWATEWIWLGVVANDDAALLRGAAALADGPLADPAHGTDEVATAAEARVHALAKEMVAAPDASARVSLYGPLLAECGTCHQRLEAQGRTPQ